MSKAIVARLYLGTVAILLIALGGMIVFAPTGFYAGYGIDLTGQTSLLNELRAPGLFMLGLGGFVGIGAVRSVVQHPALWLGALFNLAYGLARFMGMAVDGMPHSGFVVAGVTDLVLGGIKS